MIIEALPLLLMSLDVQIRNHGGEGFNCNVGVSACENSYSVLYKFDTADGVKVLMTQNAFQVGIIESDSGISHVMYYPDKFEFSLVRVAPAPKLPGGKILVHSYLGATFPAAMAALKQNYPNQVNWNRITPPPKTYI